jgi:NADPH-ferrihemoprotein reductase
VALTVVRYSTQQYGEHEGVATTWLHRLADPLAAAADPGAAAAAAGLRLPIFLRRGGAFGPPESLETPLVMIGPGTGVTPFRGFLQHRRAQLAASAADGGSGGSAKRGAAWLYFGCRREDQDYLYRQDLEA